MRLYMAGAEAWFELLADMGVKNQLFSYYYLRGMLRKGGTVGKVSNMFARMKRAKAKGYSFFLDSGAFTYQEATQKGAPLPPARAYFEEFKSFCMDHGDLFDIIAELDIEGCPDGNGGVVKLEDVDAWTDELIGVVGPKVMAVYHGNTRSKQWLQSWLLQTSSPYVGFSSDTVDGAAQTIAMAHRYGKFIHGFAQTRIQTDMKQTPFDSVDSSTWLRADRFGGTNIFFNGKWIVLDHLHKHQRMLYKSYYEQWGLDPKLIAQDDLYENRKANIVAWRELANSIEAKAMHDKQGRLPYMLDLTLKGKIPDEHPIVTKYKRDKANS